MKTDLDYVLAYSHKSYSVIPIVGKDKKPAIQSWESNQSLFRRNYISAKGIFSKYVLNTQNSTPGPLTDNHGNIIGDKRRILNMTNLYKN